MSAAIKQYYLRTEIRREDGSKKLMYLSGVEEEGFVACFNGETKFAWSFDPIQRADFIAKYPYITGRWVRVHAEQARIRAKGNT